jgi:serine/threonine protein phosphatase PrpC
MPLELVHGHASLAGSRPVNEDFCGLIAPRGAELEAKGVLAAIADGVAGEGGGRQASEYTVRGLLSDYYATPDTWAIPFAFDRVLSAINRWLVAQSRAQRNTASLATTLTALVLRGSRYVVAHVGDSRAYRWRAGALEQLTRDHIFEQPDLRHVLTRAIGLDVHLALDYTDGELLKDDVFVLATDGVWAFVGTERMREVLEQHGEPAAAAEALCQAALARGGNDNASALVIRVLGVPRSGLADSLADANRLPIPRALRPGDVIDGFEVLEPLHASRTSLLYKVRRADSGQLYALKTLQPGNEAEAAALLTEEWMARRVQSEHFAEVLPLAPGQRSALYFVMSYHPGQSLAEMRKSGHRFAVGEAAAIGTRLLKALAVLHRLNIVHRDVKPENVLIGPGGSLRLLDLGVAHNEGAAHERSPSGLESGAGQAGTPSYMAPELFAAQPASASSDLYAAGVTLYQLLSGRYPYGEIEPFQNPRFGDPVPPSRWRRDLPPWLEAILLKAVAREPARRFETAEEFLLALERGPQSPLEVPRRSPLVERDPARVWGAIALVSLVANLVLAWLLLASKAG